MPELNQVEIVDDAKLLKMAAPRAAELFPVFQRAESLWPLLILLAVLPGLYAVQCRTLDENAALWGLRSLNTISPTSANVYTGARRPQDAEMLRWQPPLGPWLTAQLMSWFGPSRWIELIVVSYLSTIGLIFSMFCLCRRLVGSRFAFWAVLLLSLNPLVLRQIQNPAPQSLALFAAVVTFWGYIAHRQDEESLVSFKLLASGIAMGICLLSGGPLCLIVIAILLVHILALRGESLTPGRRPLAQRRQVWTGWPALESLMVAVATAFAVGGWWIMMMSWQYGGEFWINWLTGASQAADQLTPTVSARIVLGRLVFMNGGVVGLTLLGIWCAGLELVKPSDELRRRRLQFLVAWAGVALVVWLNMARDNAVASYVQELWDGFLLLPCIAFAALAIDEISRRRVSILVAVGASCVSFAAALIGPSLRAEQAIPIESFLQSPLARSFALVAMLVASLFVGTRLLRTFGTRIETRRQLLLTMLLVAQLGVNAGIGIATARRGVHGDDALAACRKELATVEPAARCTIVKESEPPPSLWFLIRSLWPEAELRSVGSWDEALSFLLVENTTQGGDALVFDWTSRDTRPANLHVEGLDVAAVSRPQAFRGRQLRAYRVKVSNDAPKVATVGIETGSAP